MNDPEPLPEIAAALAEQLEPTETLVWVGQPRPDLAFRRGLVGIPFGLLLGGVPSYFMVRDHICLATCAVPFLGIGLLLMAAPWLGRRQVRRMMYALSDRRVFIVRPRWGGTGKCTTFTPEQMNRFDVTERDDGSGTIIFHEETKGSGEDATTTRTGFEGIDDVRAVERLMRETLVDLPMDRS